MLLEAGAVAIALDVRAPTGLKEGLHELLAAGQCEGAGACATTDTTTLGPEPLMRWISAG